MSISKRTSVFSQVTMPVALQTFIKCYFIELSGTPKGLCGVARVMVKLEELPYEQGESLKRISLCLRQKRRASGCSQRF